MITFCLLYLPNFIFSLIVTIERKNVAIIWQHPYLIALPTYTFFTFSKSCVWSHKSGDGHKISFSNMYSFINMAISSVSIVLVFINLRLTMGEEIYLMTFDHLPLKPTIFITLLLIPTPMFVIGLILSTAFIDMELFCGKCCHWCKEELYIHIYDAEEDKIKLREKRYKDNHFFSGIQLHFSAS